MIEAALDTNPSFEEEMSRRKRTGAKVEGGKLRTGVVASNGGAGAKSSIPTRFETILNTGVRERNAFGRRTYRFDEQENDLPGPGSYNIRSSNPAKVVAAGLAKQSELSYSKKGSAAFAKVVGITPSVVRKGTQPGPGAYFSDIVPSDPAALDKRALGVDAKPHAVFATPTPKPVIRPTRTANPVPGPGQYFSEGVPTTLQAPCSALCARSAANAHAAAAPPGGAPVTSKAPHLGPGSYLKAEHYSMTTKEAFRPSHFSLSGTSRFGPPKNHQDAEKRYLATALPPLLASSVDVDRLGVPVVVKQVRDLHYCDSLRQNTAPAGLSTTAEVNTTSPSRDERRKPSAMFSETNLDRFGRPIIRYTAPPSDELGPGSYELESRPKRMLISSSWALSGSKRDEPHDRYLPPGPAYYSPPRGGGPGRVSHRVPDPAAFVS